MNRKIKLPPFAQHIKPHRCGGEKDPRWGGKIVCKELKILKHLNLIFKH